MKWMKLLLTLSLLLAIAIAVNANKKHNTKFDEIDTKVTLKNETKLQLSQHFNSPLEMDEISFIPKSKLKKTKKNKHKKRNKSKRHTKKNKKNKKKKKSRKGRKRKKNHKKIKNASRRTSSLSKGLHKQRIPKVKSTSKLRTKYSSQINALNELLKGSTLCPKGQTHNKGQCRCPYMSKWIQELRICECAYGTYKDAKGNCRSFW